VAQESVRFREGQAKGSLAATVRYVTYLSGRRSTDAIYYQVVSAVPPSTIPSSYNGPSVKRFRCHRALSRLDMLLLCAALFATSCQQPHFLFPSGCLPQWPGAGPYRRCQARSANDDFGDCTHFLCRPRHLGDGMEGGGDGS
jgi:hypothetical protein